MLVSSPCDLIQNSCEIVQNGKPGLTASDVLDELLATLEVGATHFTACDIRRGWSVKFDACQTATLHYCLAGTGTLTLPRDAIALNPHTFVLLPAGIAYCLESSPSSPIRLEYRQRLHAPQTGQSVPTVTVGQGEPGMSTACGEVSIGPQSGPDPFSFLRAPLVARFDDAEGLRSQFVMMLAEASRSAVGSRALIETLLKQCLILALRRCIQQGDRVLPWLFDVSDSGLALALKAIFRQPEAPFTVERLATIAGMSRSSFAASFTENFGRSPMSLVKIVRLRRAAELLTTTSLPVADVAKRAGFSSRSNFSHSFSLLYGTDPSGFRRASRQVTPLALADSIPP